MELSIDSSDRTVWRVAQANQMILMTANRSMKGEESLEQVLREENTQDLHNCHKHWRGYAAPYTKELDQTHENIWSFQLLN